jgi:adenylylsulfate kinase
MKILIMGLPGAGKTTLAEALSKELSAIHLNADEMRNKVWSDLTFTYEDRIKQAQRMGALSDILNAKGYNTIADFICPTEETRKVFGEAFIIWVNRIDKGRFEDTNKLFEKPSQVNVCIDAGLTIEEEVKLIMKELN